MCYKLLQVVTMFGSLYFTKVAGTGRMLVVTSTKPIFGRHSSTSGASGRRNNHLYHGLGLLLQPLRPYCTYAPSGMTNANGGAATRTEAPH